MFSMRVSGDVDAKTMRINGVEHPVSYEGYSTTVEDGISSIILFADDISGENHVLLDMTSAFTQLSDNLIDVSFDYPNYLSCIDFVAAGCSSLTGVSLVGLTAVQSAQKMFENCAGMTDLSIMDNSFVERIGDGDAFAGCGSLSGIRFVGRLSSYQANQ